jgi:hypothetical protein
MATSVLPLTFERLDEFTMFEKSLTDLIRGIRANKKSEHKYISACLQEIRNEVKSNDIDVKANAIAKLTYVSELGPYCPYTACHTNYSTMKSFKCLDTTCHGHRSMLWRSCPRQSSCIREQGTLQLLNHFNKTPMCLCYVPI